MADDNNARYRSSDSLGRGSAPAGQSNDPLAELARLIGRNDPFADLVRDPHPAPQRDIGTQDHGDPGHAESTYAPSSYASEPAPQESSDPAPRYRTDATPHDSDSVSHFGGGDTPRYGNDPLPPRLDWPGGPDSVQPRAADPFSLLSERSRMPPAPSYEREAYADPSGLSAMDNDLDRPAFGEPVAQPPPDQPAFLQALYPQASEAGPIPPSLHDDEFYDDTPRSERRKGLLTVAAVLALAVIGTAGAFAYRNMFGGASSSSPPPVIRASGEPSKVAPPTQPVDQTASKFSYDRFGDRGQNEKVVVREEKPVDNRELARTSVPRAALPSAPAAPSAPTAQGNPNPPSALGEPRRVRTVPIRPDQPDSAAAPQALAGQQAAPMQIAPAPQPPAARQPAAVAEVPNNSRADASAPAVNTRAAAPRSNPRVAAPSDNAPLSLSPDSNNTPPPRAAAPARVAAAPAGNGGGYLVQVASQKSEADAQSSYRAIQSKYSNVLSGQRHIIRRADLGSKGVYYRAMVGPFGSREQAVQLCSSLKAAGGDCVVQAN